MSDTVQCEAPTRPGYSTEIELPERWRIGQEPPPGTGTATEGYPGAPVSGEVYPFKVIRIEREVGTDRLIGMRGEVGAVPVRGAYILAFLLGFATSEFLRRRKTK